MSIPKSNDKRLVIFLAFFIYGHALFSQRPYFQQQVDYRIEVRLNDSLDLLHAVETLTYTNHSPDTLRVILFHLWPNAYKNRSTALANQLLENRRPDLYFSKKEERGWVDSLNFSVNGVVCKWEYDPTHIDICKVYLTDAIHPGKSAVISTPFRVKIPDAKFSRLGHTGDAFFITQWYPKPAVYDRQGWHAMPYLDQGEFFSEFGNFDVRITLPENYVLATSGDLVDAPGEENFLSSKVIETKKHITQNTRREKGMDFPASSPKYKTLRFIRENAHDFAWFADKRFYVLSEEVVIPDGQKIKAWVYFTEKNFSYWEKAVSYVSAAVVFYSEKVGAYPYKHATAVDGTIMAGGGMEYPCITVIGDVDSDFELDQVIAHEVGHNWFYGILGSNERDHPFLDEGINSFYESRYLKARYPGKNLSAFLGRDANNPLFGMKQIPVWKYHEISYFGSARGHNDQPMDLRSHDYSESNYGSIVYSKSALALDYLLDFLGEDTMDLAMRQYFSAYKYKHPTPDDLFTTLEQSTKKDLGWFKENLYHTNKKIDFKIASVKKKNGFYQLNVINKSKTPVPFRIAAFAGEKRLADLWVKDTGDRVSLKFQVSHAERFVIDPDHNMPDLYRSNNSIKGSGLIKHRKPFKLKLLTAFESPNNNQSFFAPVMGGNYYNGFMGGLVFHNYGFIQKKWEWHLTPMYGFRSQDVNGNAEVNRHFYPRTTFQQITVGVKVKRYGYDLISRGGSEQDLAANTLSYFKASPFINFDLKKKDPRSPKNSRLNYTSHLMWTDSAIVRGDALTSSTKQSFVNELAFEHKNGRVIDPYRFMVNFQHTASMAKLSVAFLQKFTINQKRSVDLRVFGGSFIAGSFEERSYYAFRAAGYNGWHDYLFEGNYLGRNERSGLPFTQFMVRDGGMKTWSPQGQSATWLAGVNLLSPRFFGIFRLFADAVTCDPDALVGVHLLYDVGINLVLWQDIMEVYFPLFTDVATANGFENNQLEWHEKFRFTFNIHKLDAKKIIQSSWN